VHSKFTGVSIVLWICTKERGHNCMNYIYMIVFIGNAANCSLAKNLGVKFAAFLMKTVIYIQYVGLMAPLLSCNNFKTQFNEKSVS
jgi:hypothetical protein